MASTNRVLVMTEPGGISVLATNGKSDDYPIFEFCVMPRDHGDFALVLPRFRVLHMMRGDTDVEAYLPHWMLLLTAAIPTAWLWHRDRRRIRPGCCLRCGYDLTGNTSGVCPECGDKVHPPVVLADSECGEKLTPVSQAPSRQGRV